MKKNKLFTSQIPCLLFAIFILPLLLSFIVYQYYNAFHFKTTNHGTLLKPPLQLSTLSHDNHWQLAFSPEHCDTADAQQTLFFLHQLRRALGEAQDRVRLTLLLTRPCPPRFAHDFYPLMLNREQQIQLHNHLPKNNTRITEKIYLIDPAGNLFMYYPSNIDVMAIFSDMKKLL